MLSSDRSISRSPLKQNGNNLENPVDYNTGRSTGSLDGACPERSRRAQDDSIGGFNAKSAEGSVGKDFVNNFAQKYASLVLPPLVKLRALVEMDNIIEAKELQIERKHFYVELRENDRGTFLRITEEAHGRRNTIIVPSTGVDDFTAAIDEVLDGVEILPA